VLRRPEFGARVEERIASVGNDGPVPANAFARLNAAKLLALPRFVLGDLLSLFVPRDPGRWVVGSAFGVHDGARALVAEALSRPAPPLVTWLARTPAEAQAARILGAHVEPHGSWGAIRAALRAGVVVVTHGFGDASRFGSRGALVVNLWHGSPLKKMHLDSPAALRLPLVGGWSPARGLIRRMYRRGTSRIRLAPAGSPVAASRLQSAFGLPDGRVEVLGEPRTDVLFTGPPEQRRTRAHARLEQAVGALGGRRVVLFAPTWRDGHADPVVPTAAEWQEVERWLGDHDAVLVVRPHPLGVGDYERSSDQVRLLTSSTEPDVMAVLPAVDALVTDYSSILVDFAVTGGPVVFLAPDETTYAAGHGLYEPYAETTGGRVERSWAQALVRLAEVMTPGPAREESLRHSAQLADRYHPVRDGGSAARVVDRVLELTGGVSGGTGGSRGGAEPSGVVFFESFNGRNVSCNPAAIDRELARRAPCAQRVWSVLDARTPVPPGARAVVVGSPEWRSARDAADLLVVNDWIEDGWRPRRHQFVLQTWHGTPLKRIALGRRDLSPRAVAAVVKQSTRWSAMLAQSPAASRVLRRAYAVLGPMWVEGYPRDDVVATGDDGGAREALGVSTSHVVLYAPTWRDGALDAPDLLDVQAFAAGLGPDWTVLVRGHARTMEARAAAGGDRVVDVTRYPDVSPLLATADVLVTDYSSVMFDFSASGRPMVFFVPDQEEYATTTRGFYWDLGRRAPGPLVRTTSECVDAVLSAERDQQRWAARYAAWRAEFNPLDDGGASRRVVDRLLARGVLPPRVTGPRSRARRGQRP
jgi:CDP-glycerol glycerophosphotransferase